jgi:predicted nucleotidyltransferase
LTEQVIMHGLHQKTIDALHTVLEKEDGVEAAVLYGSRAMGTYRNGSDKAAD